MEMRKAIALMSGGLDSTLAARLIKDQGVEVIGLHLLSPFGCKKDVSKNATAIGVKLLFRNKGESYLDLVKNPHFGYGKNMNPCIDCRIFMFDLAEKVMKEEMADFLVTGEVLGQRPMSQRREAMDIIDNHSSLKGLVVRPLSAGRLKPTLPEERGWVRREDLLKICGRGRGIQFELAKSLGINVFDAPGGGCLLTEAAFSDRLRDHFAHETTGEKDRVAKSALLRLGRHFRLTSETKVILGRNQAENEELTLKWRAAGGVYFDPESFDGPNAVALGPVNTDQKRFIGEMMLRYSRASESAHTITFESSLERGRFSVQNRTSEENLEALRI